MSQAATSFAGDLIAERYVVQDVIGTGRSATVYRTLDLQTKTTVALKVLDPLLARDPVTVERFRREVTILRALTHPNVVRVYDAFPEGDVWILCMEYFAALDAKTHLRRVGRMEMGEFLVHAKHITLALAACHRQHVLHRDLKPQNILIGDGTLKLVDFGVSRLTTMADLTRTGTILGTPEYMAPELFATTRSDPRSDIYSLGAVLYEFLTGRPPYAAGSLPELMTRQLRALPEPITEVRADVPRWVESIVLKCLRIDPGDRYQSCEEVLRDLDRGGRAVAGRCDESARAVCVHCRAPRLPGLPFCHCCGRFGIETYESGHHTLVLYECAEPDAVAEFLARLCSLPSPARLRRRLASTPVVLLRDICDGTARALSHELAAFGCDVRFVRGLHRHFQLPRVLHLFAILFLLPVWLVADTVGQRLGLTAAAIVALGLLYWWAARPAISFARLSAGAAGPDPTLVELARGVSQVHDRNLQTTLGHICVGLVRLQTHGASDGAVDLSSVRRLVFTAAEAAGVLERYELYLSSRSLNEIREQRDAVEMRLAAARDAALVDDLLATRAKLGREFDGYQEIQDLYSRAYIALLDLNALLQRLGDAGARREAAVEAELRDLESSLRLDAQPLDDASDR